MKRNVILTVALLCALSPLSSAKPLKVFILAGQSNMEGHGGVQTLDQLGKHPMHGHLLKKNQGSARVYCLVGYSLAEAIKPLLATKR
jgi:hypothetical protein